MSLANDSAVAERPDTSGEEPTAVSNLGPDRPVEEMTTEELRELVAQLREAAESRHMIGMAKGLLMATERVTSDRAFDILRRASNNQNTAVRYLAEWMVTRHDAEFAKGETPL